MKILPVLVVPIFLIAACAQYQTPEKSTPAATSGGSLVDCQTKARSDFLNAARANGLTVQGEGDDAQVQAGTSAEIETVQRLYQQQLADMDACAAKAD